MYTKYINVTIKKACSRSMINLFISAFVRNKKVVNPIIRLKVNKAY